ncbi:MAG TPA: glutathione S-transferase family protein [Polyangiaceae bacterium]|jgi:glutathione S-transferase
MSLTLYFHPLASYCWKVLLALYENETPFTPKLVDLANEAERAELLRLWPIGKFPVLRDDARNCVVPESTTIIEYLAQYYPGRAELLPADAERARRVRFKDRFFDLYVHERMQRIVADRIRPADKKDPYGVSEAKGALATAYDTLEAELADANQQWAAGTTFTLADCAAAPALFYGNLVLPIEGARLKAYHDRLLARPAMARVLKEAEPYMQFFPRA